MKHVPVFNTFLSDVVNINDSRIATLEQRVGSIIDFLKESELLHDAWQDARTQGSWATKTIIKPLPGNDFDADLRIYLSALPNWEPKDYINNIYQLFRDSEVYKDKVSRKTRCITITYAGYFHLDIVPCVEGQGTFVVFNRHDNVFELTDADGYTKWFKDQDSIIGNHQLVKTVRLIKYLRDIKGTFTAKSILLTTLTASQVSPQKGESEFSDLPTSLCTISNRLNNYLQATPVMPIVRNPALLEEDFNRHWDQERYENFRAKWADYTAKMNDAFHEEDRDTSIEKWQQIFGEGFGARVESRQSNVKIAAHPPSPWSRN